MAGGYAVASVALNTLSSVISGVSQRKAIKRANELKLQRWEQAFSELRSQLGVAYNRTSVGISEANRQKVANKLSIRKAAHKAVGSRETTAAQIGQAGRRAKIQIYNPIKRVEAEALTTEEVNAQTKMDSLVNHFNDTALQAINALNSAAPVAEQVPSTFGILMGATNTALGSYSALTPNQKEDFKNTFSGFKSSLTGSTPTPQIGE